MAKKERGKEGKKDRKDGRRMEEEKRRELEGIDEYFGDEMDIEKMEEKRQEREEV